MPHNFLPLEEGKIKEKEKAVKLWNAVWSDMRLIINKTINKMPSLRLNTILFCFYTPLSEVLRILPGELVWTQIWPWKGQQEHVRSRIGIGPGAIPRNNKVSLPAGEVKKMHGICLVFYCVRTPGNPPLVQTDFSRVPLVWTDTCIHHHEENTISFLSRITSSSFILSPHRRLYPSRHSWFPYLLLNL